MSASRAAVAAAPFLAFDFGTKRVGVASGNSVTRTASALTTLAQAGDDRAVHPGNRALCKQGEQRRQQGGGCAVRPQAVEDQLALFAVGKKLAPAEHR